MIDKLSKEAKEYMDTPIQVGDYVEFPLELVKPLEEKNKTTHAIVEEFFSNGKCIVRINDSSITCNKETFELNISDLEKDPWYVGYNPFSETIQMPKINFIPCCISSLLSTIGEYSQGPENEWTVKSKSGRILPVKFLNWNPYVINKDGEKQYYQRDFCWSLDEKKQLIESIYRGVDCGKIVLREHSYDEVEKTLKNDDEEIAFYDIVDGKQRLNALIEFVNDKYPDLNGKYFSDMSLIARKDFRFVTCFTLATMNCRTTDDDVLKTFLLVNYAGKQMTQEHLDYVKNILETI